MKILEALQELDHHDVAEFQKLLTNALMAQEEIAYELKKLNENLENGRAIVRTHTTNCVAPPMGKYTVRQLEVMSSFLHKAIETGALVLPPKEGDKS